MYARRVSLQTLLRVKAHVSKLVGRGEGPKCLKESKCRPFRLCKETPGHFFQFLSLFFFGENKTLTKCYIHVDWLVGSYRCWAVLKCWPGSQPGSHNENQFTPFLKMWEQEWKPTSGSHMIENRFKKCIHIYFFGEPDRFSHRTQIRFSEFSVSFNWVPLVLLLTWDNYYSSLFITITLLFTAITVLPLLLFSLYWYYSSLYYCLLFSHGVSLFVWWSHLNINYLIYLKLILINENFNNQDVVLYIMRID